MNSVIRLLEINKNLTAKELLDAINKEYEDTVFISILPPEAQFEIANNIITNYDSIKAKGFAKMSNEASIFRIETITDDMIYRNISEAIHEEINIEVNKWITNKLDKRKHDIINDIIDMIENNKLDIEKYIGYMEMLSKLKSKNYDYELRLLLMICKSLDDNTITKEDTYNLINNMA